MKPKPYIYGDGQHDDYDAIRTFFDAGDIEHAPHFIAEKIHGVHVLSGGDFFFGNKPFMLDGKGWGLITHNFLRTTPRHDDAPLHSMGLGWLRRRNVEKIISHGWWEGAF